MDIQTIVTIVTGVVAGASLALKFIAPLTENKVDDNIQKGLIKVLRVLSVDSDYDKYKVRLNK